MSELNEESIKYLSGLCRIAVKESDIPVMCRHIKGVLDYMALLLEVDVSHLSPYAHLEALELCSLREDEVKDLLPRDKFLANASDTIGGFVRVPPVINK